MGLGLDNSPEALPQYFLLEELGLWNHHVLRHFCFVEWWIVFYFSIDLEVCSVRSDFSIVTLKKSQTSRVGSFSFPLVKLDDPTMIKPISISRLSTWFPVLSLSQWNNEMHILIPVFWYFTNSLLWSTDYIHPPGFVNKVSFQHNPVCSVACCLWFHWDLQCQSGVLVAETIWPTFLEKVHKSLTSKKKGFELK